MITFSSDVFLQDLKETIDRLVGNINGAFSTAAWSPIRYIYGNINQNELSSFYRDAQVNEFETILI